MYVYSCTGATPHIFGTPTRTLHAAFSTVIATTRNVPGHIHTSMTLPCFINREAVPQPLSPIQLLRVVHPLWRRIIQKFLCIQSDPPIPCHSWIQPQASYPETHFLASHIIFRLTHWYPFFTHTVSQKYQQKGALELVSRPFIFTNPSRPSISPLP
jgi:hypothetical protein